MIFAVYAGENDESIKSNLGMPDYSYYFVLKSYLPVLDKLGSVFIIHGLEKERPLLEQLYQECQRRSEPFLFLSFTPPHITDLSQLLPSLTVFAWEYSTIPQDSWGGNAQNDWRCALGQEGRAITHSRYAVTAVKQAMGDDYPIVSVPAPLWDAFSTYYRQGLQAINPGGSCLRYHGCLLDSRDLDYCGVTPQDKDEQLEELAMRHLNPDEQQLNLNGVVYTAVMNPIDGRKNWLDLLSAFCWAFREHADVTLLIKVTHFDVERVWLQYTSEFYKLVPFKCRVVLMHGFLEDAAYGELIAATSYIVNCAHGEGQCLPLMEFMSAGIPAIAPDHTAMADYISVDNAFVVKSNREWIHWPHDPRLNFRAFQYRIDWESLYDVYLKSYEIAVNEPGTYQTLSANANRDLRQHCSRAVAARKLAAFFGGPGAMTLKGRLKGTLRNHYRFFSRRKLIRAYASKLDLYRRGVGAGR